MQISTCFKVLPILNTCLYFYLYYLFCYSKILRKTSQKFTRNRSERERMLLALQYWLNAHKMKKLSLPKNLQWYVPLQDKVLVQSPKEMFKQVQLMRSPPEFDQIAIFPINRICSITNLSGQHTDYIKPIYTIYKLRT